MLRLSTRYDTKIVLWTLLIVQLLLIGVFWVLQTAAPAAGAGTGSGSGSNSGFGFGPGGFGTNGELTNDGIVSSSADVVISANALKGLTEPNRNTDNHSRNIFAATGGWVSRAEKISPSPLRPAVRFIQFKSQRPSQLRKDNHYDNSLSTGNNSNNNSSNSANSRNLSTIEKDNRIIRVPAAGDSDNRQGDIGSRRKIQIKNISNFNSDFQTYRIVSILSTNIGKVFCFREGTELRADNSRDPYTDADIKIINITNDNVHDYDGDRSSFACQCKSQWHGKDCGQPEIFWRAFMTSKVPLSSKISHARRVPRKIFYMITGHLVSIEMLQIQMMELFDIVDFFIICNRNNDDDSFYNGKNSINTNRNNGDNEDNMEKDTNKNSQIELISGRNSDRNNGTSYNSSRYNNSNNNNNNNNSKTKSLKLNFLKTININGLSFSNRYIIIDNVPNCLGKKVYKEFRKRLDSVTGSTTTIQPDDMFLLSNYDEILNRKAIKYLKYYYNNIPNLIRFRLKYNVYGFFLQHPESTRIGSAACTIEELEKNYKSNPDRLLLMRNRKEIIIVGDLNHFGGWYCEYCYQPHEIVTKLRLNAFDIFPNSSKNHQIDSVYLQSLIGSSLYVDGKLGLTRLYRFSDKYFAPDYVVNNQWLFNNLLTNFYATLDDDDSYDFK